MRLLSFLLSTFILVSCSSEPEPSQHLLTGLNVINIETGDIRPGHSILIEGDQIAAIFEDGSQATNASQITNMDGKYAIPALWDMHIHLRGGEELAASNRQLLPLYVAHGITTVRDAGGDLTPAIFNWRDEIAKEDLTGPYIYTSGPKLDGPNPTWEGSIEVNQPEEVAAALDSLAALGVDYVKIYESRLSREVYLEIIRQTEERGLKVTGHMPMDVMIDEALAAGLDGIEHLYYVLKGTSERESEITDAVQNGELGFWQAVAELKNSFNADTARAFYLKLADNQVYVTPTLHIDDILSFLHEDDHSEDEFLAHIPDDIENTYQRRVESAAGRSPEMIQFEEELNAIFGQITLGLQQAGVHLLAGSDAGAYNSFVYPGPSLHKELQAFTRAGLTPLEALQTSSYNGALFFGDYDTIGSLEESKIADILILDENPLFDISNTEMIHALVKKGELLNKKTLSGLVNSTN